MRGSRLAFITALAAWALAVAGAAGLAYIIALDRATSLLLIGSVALVAFFGSALPILRLVSRNTARQNPSEARAAQKSNSQR
jgi:hypothetical protein